MFCPNCGTNNADGVGYCVCCGAPLAAQAPQQPYAQPQQPQQPYGAQPNPGYNPGYTQPNPAYTQPAPAYPVMPGVVAPKNLVTCILLSIITCGIYAYYWMYTLTEDVNKLSGNVAGTSGGTVILLSIITCGIYAWIWMYKQGEAIDGMKAARGIPSSGSGVIYLLLSFFGLGIVSYALMQNEVNKLCGGM